jgi:hypothetical protein
MWTAVRLLTVCVLGASGLFALRSGLPSHPPRPPPPAVHAGADDVARVGLITEKDVPTAADEIQKKIVTVERFHVDVVDVAALQANAKAAPETQHHTHYRRHVRHRHWYRGKRHRLE